MMGPVTMNNSTTSLMSANLEQEMYQFRLIVNIIGICLSFLGYSLMVLTAVLFPSWRKKEQNQLWLHMCGCYLVYFTLAFYTFVNPIQNEVIRVLVENLKRFFGKASLCWMLVGAWLTYKNLVDVFSYTGHYFMLKASLFSYLTPLFLVGITYTLYIIEHPEHLGANVSIAPKFLDQKYKDAIWYVTWFFDRCILVVPVYGSIILYLIVTYSLYKNRKVQGHERDLASSVALGFFFVFTCCLQCAIITAKFIFLLGGIWSYVIICLQSFHVSTYTTLFIVCNRVTRRTWLDFLKSKFTKK